MARRGPKAAHTAPVGDTGTRLEKPAMLTPAASAIWDAIVPRLTRLGLLLDIDATVLESFCAYRAQWLEYTGRLAALDPATPEHARVAKAANDAHQRLEKCIGELGLSPNARARLKLEGSEQAANEIEEFLRKGSK